MLAANPVTNITRFVHIPAKTEDTISSWQTSFTPVQLGWINGNLDLPADMIDAAQA